MPFLEPLALRERLKTLPHVVVIVLIFCIHPHPVICSFLVYSLFFANPVLVAYGNTASKGNFHESSSFCTTQSSFRKRRLQRGTNHLELYMVARYWNVFKP